MPHLPATSGRSATNGRVSLGRTTLLREVYRSLLNTGRTYAAFREEDRNTISRLVDRSPIFDPMSGYGGLAGFCAELGVTSFGVEYNPAQFFWQLLLLPSRTGCHLAVIKAILQQRRNWPRPRERAVVSDEFFPEETLSVLRRLHSSIEALASELPIPDGVKPSEVAAAILLPFSGRLACTSPVDISTHTKEGGTCVLLGWQDDFFAYLIALKNRLQLIETRSKCTTHEVVLGDARLINLGAHRFRSMFTSPPYPNHRDFSTILLPENTLLSVLAQEAGSDLAFVRQNIIGSNFVKGTEDGVPTVVGS